MKNMNVLFALVLIGIGFGNLNAADKPAPMTLQIAQQLVRYLEAYDSHLDDDENSIDRVNYAQALATIKAHEESQKAAVAKSSAASAASAAATANSAPTSAAAAAALPNTPASAGKSNK
jgi:proline racemase